MTIELRDATPGDAAAIKEVFDEHSLAAFGEVAMAEEEIRSWFAHAEHLDAARRARRPGGRLPRHHVRGERSPVVDARTLDPEVAPVLLEAAEARGRELAKTPILRGFVQGHEPVLRQAFEAGGWTLIRHFFQMRIELDGDLPEPVWPDGLAPRNVEPGEEERVYEAHMDAFADHWDFRRQPLEVWRAYSTDTHRYDPSLWWLVEDGDELAAISMNGWDFSGDPQFGWIQVLGVRPRWRKRGLATALLRHSFRDFRGRGATKVGLGVDGESTTGAVRLYETVGMRQVRRSDTYEKTL